MKIFNKVAIVGTGLIGGSLALAIKKNRLANEVIGVSRHKKTLLLAKKSGAIDQGSCDISIIRDADLVILATPVNTVINLAPKISRIVDRACIVTDVGSTKEEIVRRLQKFFPNYVGTHPLAGSERRGMLNARVNLFRDSLCILTPTQKTPNLALNKIKKLWIRLGAKTILLNPSTHDKILSFVSHLPHAVAFSLIRAVPKEYLKFAASGLKDTTRIAASESELWTDIFLSNKDLLEAIDIFQRNLSKIRAAIKKKDRAALNRILKQAKSKREILG